MTFIRSCNGTFKNKKDQNGYDILKECVFKGQALMDDFLISTVETRLKVTDIHYDIMNAMLDRCRANFNLSRQVLLPMQVELYEFAVKLLASKKPEMKKQRKLFLPDKEQKNSFEYLFNRLKDVLNKAISTLSGQQEMGTLYKYFMSCNDRISDELKNIYHIINNDLFDGLISCRTKYEFFLKLAVECEAKFMRMLDQLKDKQKFLGRWKAIHQLATEDMLRLYQIQERSKSTFFLVPLDIEQMKKEIDDKLAKLFGNEYNGLTMEADVEKQDKSASAAAPRPL